MSKVVSLPQTDKDRLAAIAQYQKQAQVRLLCRQHGEHGLADACTTLMRGLLPRTKPHLAPRQLQPVMTV